MKTKWTDKNGNKISKGSKIRVWVRMGISGTLQMVETTVKSRKKDGTISVNGLETWLGSPKCFFPNQVEVI